jgi:hypothetical protein
MIDWIRVSFPSALFHYCRSLLLNFHLYHPFSPFHSIFSCFLATGGNYCRRNENRGTRFWRFSHRPLFCTHSPSVPTTLPFNYFPCKSACLDFFRSLGVFVCESFTINEGYRRVNDKAKIMMKKVNKDVDKRMSIERGENKPRSIPILFSILLFHSPPLSFPHPFLQRFPTLNSFPSIYFAFFPSPFLVFFPHSSPFIL